MSSALVPLPLNPNTPQESDRSTPEGAQFLANDYGSEERRVKQPCGVLITKGGHNKYVLSLGLEPVVKGHMLTLLNFSKFKLWLALPCLAQSKEVLLAAVATGISHQSRSLIKRESPKRR